MRILLPFITTLYSLFQFFYQPAQPNDNLDLNRVDTMRVSLYGTERPDSLHVSNPKALLVLYSENQAVTLASDSV
jgi:hypothetical protein